MRTSVAGRRCSSLKAGTTMLSTRRSPARTRCGSLTTLEPPVHREHRLAAQAPGLDRQPPRPLETEATDRRRSPADTAGKEVERSADPDPDGRPDRSEVAVEEQLLAAAAKGGKDN